jgi:hypothetical protein
MSEASRAAALQHAASVHHGSNDAAATLETAEAFHSFINSGNAGETSAAPPSKPAKVAKAAAPAKQKPAPEPEVEADDEPAGDEVTKEQVGESIEAMLNANLRTKAIALFAKYKAKSLSQVKPEDYAALKAEADDLLLNA